MVCVFLFCDESKLYKRIILSTYFLFLNGEMCRLFGTLLVFYTLNVGRLRQFGDFTFIGGVDRRDYIALKWSVRSRFSNCTLNCSYDYKTGT